MIDEIYNSRIGAIKTCRSSDEWEKTAIAFEKSLTEDYGVPQSRERVIFFGFKKSALRSVIMMC